MDFQAILINFSSLWTFKRRNVCIEAPADLHKTSKLSKTFQKYQSFLKIHFGTPHCDTSGAPESKTCVVFSGFRLFWSFLVPLAVQVEKCMCRSPSGSQQIFRTFSKISKLSQNQFWDPSDTSGAPESKICDFLVDF